ncbi:MAG TPA: S-layer protein domain-containing protein [Methanothrix sp.]|nr:S-layer protein domain-containing protein [Methanothrix sp.]
MHNIRVGGVCLLLLLLAAALPFNAMAQEPQTGSSSASQSDNAGNDAASIISKSLAAKTSQEEGLSVEKPASSRRGLKPLGSTAQTGTSQSVASTAPSTTPASAAPDTADTTTENAATAEDAASSQAAAADVPATTATEDTVTPDEIETVEAVTGEPEMAQAVTEPIEENAVTPDEIDAGLEDAAVDEPATAQVEAQPAAEPEAVQAEDAALAASTTPIENVSSGTEVSADANATQTDESLNASINESDNATEEEVADEEEDKAVNRIWREGDPTDYTWNWKSFSGFFYDMENDVGTESLTVNLESGRSIDSGNLQYKTEPKDLDFKYGEWGDYQVIGFMAEKYFAGYLASDLIDDDYSFLDDGQLRQVLVDSDDSQTLAGGSTLTLEEGYELQIKQVDIDGEKVYLGLVKDGEEIDSKVVSPEGSLESSTYEYEVEVSGEDVPIIMAHVESVFASTESDLVTVDGLFQLSDTYASVEDGDEYGKMEVKSVGQDGVEMSNEDSINLKEGGKINIFGEVGFIVADDDILRFAPIVDRTGPQEVRGSVIDPSEQEEFTWDVYNFEGFYYDIDEDVGTETLTARITDKKSIEEGDLVYETRPQAVDFEFDRWGKYDVIGFMADKYFAAYNNRTEFTDDFSVIGEGELRRVLVDNDDSQTLASGSVLSLEEGYELRIKSVDLNGNKVYLALSRDGEEVDSKVVTPSSDPGDGSSNYLYKVDMGSEDVPIVAVHIESVFRSTESDLATVDGIFQISDSPESVENGEVHGKMEVKDTSEDGITMENDGSFSLARDKTIEIMENLKFVVADSDKRLFAPVAFKPGEGMDMTVIASDAVVNSPASISVKSDSKPLAGVQIQLNGSSIGTTDATGSVSYTPSSIGTYQVVAKKKDYNDGKASLVVRTASDAASVTAYEKANATLSSQLTINAPADVVKGENFLIAVVQGINQTPVEGAEVSLDDIRIGLTGSQGTVTYAANLTGEQTLTAMKEGFNSATKSITIASSIGVVELKLPEQAYAGKEMKISAVVRNQGSNEDTLPLDLLANGTVVESKNATVKGGENSTVAFTYKPEEAGLTEFRLSDQSQSINVEPAKSNNWLIALILVLMIAVGAGIYLYSTGELEGLKRQIKRITQGR